jgi:hypothetical protein
MSALIADNVICITTIHERGFKNILIRSIVSLAYAIAILICIIYPVLTYCLPYA